MPVVKSFSILLKVPVSKEKVKVLNNNLLLSSINDCSCNLIKLNLPNSLLNEWTIGFNDVHYIFL